MPPMMACPAAITAGGSRCSRSGSAAASAGTMTWSRSSGSVPGGRAAWAALPAWTASGVARHGLSALAAVSDPVHSSAATSSKARSRARSSASRPRNRSVSSVISVSPDSMTSPVIPGGWRGRPRRASSPTSAASNRLIFPPVPRRRASTPRLT